MWPTFGSKDPFKNFPYEIGERITYANSSIWELHNGIKIASKEPVSIFVYEIKSEASTHLLEIVKNCVKRVKTLRHPNFLKYVDSVENDKFVYLITERILPLENYLKRYTNKDEKKKKMAISWGLHQICTGVMFLVNDCSLTHNNLCTASIFVDESGEWHVGGLEYVSPINDRPPSKVLSSLDKYTPPNNSKSNKWASDSWGLGCLIWEIFNGGLPNSSSLNSPAKIPDILQSRYTELITTNPNSRLTIPNFFEKCKADYMKNKFVESMLFLEQIQIKDSNELSRFYNSLPNYLDDFPPEACKQKVLQQVINSFEYGNAGSLILTSLMKIGKHLDDKEYQAKIVPVVIKLFSSKDRATRAKLMQQMDQYIGHIPSVLVNEQIFHHIISGFTDSNPIIREQTIKSIIHLAPKLNAQNLNEEVIRHFARIQTKDDQGGIRTNTTVCLGKIASYLNPETRQNILIYAFARALKDPFPPARTAGILAFSATQQYYSLQDCATKVLPSLCAATIDPEKSIRENTFKAIRGFLEKLEKGYESPSSIEKVATAAASPSQSSYSWAEWAMSSLTSKFMKPNKAGNNQPSKESEETSSSVNPPKELPQQKLSPPENDSGTSDYEDTVADAEWTAIEDEAKGDEKMEGWEWDSFDAPAETKPSPVKPPPPPEIPKSKSFNITRPAVQDWGDDSWGTDIIVAEDSKLEQQRKREERREQRQKEMEQKRQARQKQGGPLKLGARKVS